MNTQIIAVANQKGGVGKTTTCANLGISWNSDSRYCVDGILCRTPEELFDLLLQDYWDFELIRRTQGRREATVADEEAVDELCQPYLDWKKEALK